MSFSRSAAPDDVDEVRRIVLGGLGAHRAKVWFFGSRASGQPRRGSDIDVAILPLEPLPAGLLAEIRENLESSRVLATVDVVNLLEADPGLRARVEREGIPWAS
ncbi:MAG TPA: nucleotidyltransferase domain-containing protein [Thermoanaerobaculia bacterium]|jgi:predicted nucleotidyltransferase|nr:nucleotidyltransferase domain-containing protein [Thermoanaerobaculia bacterium]